MITQSSSGEPVFSTAASMAMTLRFNYELAKNYSEEYSDLFSKYKPAMIRNLELKKVCPVEGLGTEDALLLNNLKVTSSMVIMNTILFSCFSLEAYINANLFLQIDKNYKKEERDNLFTKFNSLSTIKKLNKIIELSNGKTLNASDWSFVNMELLFNFRDSIAHGKPSYIDKNKKRMKPNFYKKTWEAVDDESSTNSKLPEIFLHLSDLAIDHSFFSVYTHDEIIRELNSRSNNGLGPASIFVIEDVESEITLIDKLARSVCL